MACFERDVFFWFIAKRTCVEVCSEGEQFPLTRATTGERISAPSPGGFSYIPETLQRAAPRNLVRLFLHLFTHYVQVVTSYLERPGHQVSLNDPTSHHLFATLRPRQSQSR